MRSRSLSPETRAKYEELQRIVREMGSMLVAYSGGVDSTLLLKVGLDALGSRTVAVTASSETYPPAEITEAKTIARQLGARLISIHTDEIENPLFAANAPDRCYHCKMELFTKLKQVAEQEGLAWVAHGANADDMSDYRPGSRAAVELGIRAPLQEAGLTKPEIREISRSLGLPTWDKPQLACLSSRVPYGTPITHATLVQVGKAEELLKRLGLRQIRVRHHGTMARIEVQTEDFPVVMDAANRAKIVAGLKELGYLYVTLDLEGYRSGSMNAALQYDEP